MVKKYIIPDVLPDCIDRDDWEDFVQSRIEIGYPLTPVGARRILANLSKYPTQIQKQAMDKSISCGYRGVFPQSEKIEDSTGFIDRHSDRSWADNVKAIK